MLLQGLRWQIGNGQRTRAFIDNWVPGDKPLIPSTRPHIQNGSPTVSYFIKEGRGEWDVPKLQHCFEPQSVDLIRRIPLPRYSQQVIRVWQYSKDGKYTVKLGYHLALEIILAPSRKLIVHIIDPPIWKKTWNIQVPPKLKLFIWQCLKVILPTVVALQSRGVNCLNRCPVCWRHRGSIEHLFFRCPLAIRLWTLVGLSNFIETAQTVNFSLWWRHIISQTSLFHILQCVCLLWRIWKSRNEVTFEFTQPHVSSLARQFYNQVLEISSLLPPSSPQPLLPNIPATTWVPPPKGFLKINVDATVSASGCSPGLVIRCSDGHVMLAFGLQNQGIVNPYLAELLAFRDAISFIASRSLTHMIVERRLDWWSGVTRVSSDP
ncbi:unnamed protein product [Linum trigynum]|uniref:Reverse transcriptase zinc-binding domain-containing protein n=1 Tax=Linum trigynum TaxID=586398 RepID=A0AAV2CC48_9ROSI